MYDELFLLVEKGEKYLVGNEEEIKAMSEAEFKKAVEYLESINRVMFITNS